MQGISEFIPTNLKIDYLNTLLQVGFDTIDFGSFVSPKAIPQMSDTKEVLQALDLSNTQTKLLAIVANQRGADIASESEKISYLGYPFSISETFQLRNTNATIVESLDRVKDIIHICNQNNKVLVIYISMGFGNPYGDQWSVQICQKWVDILADLGVHIMALSDTIGVATPESISYLFKHLIPPHPEVEFGAHLHTQPHNWKPKVLAALESGCKRFDAAIRGFGGCPMAKDELTGNMATENILSITNELQFDTGINMEKFKIGMEKSIEIFHTSH